MTKIIFEKSNNDLGGVDFFAENIDLENYFDSAYLRKRTPLLPELTELEVMRHYKELSDKNFCIESGFYPLGSCTMKYNPKVRVLIKVLYYFRNVLRKFDNIGIVHQLNSLLKMARLVFPVTKIPA